MAILSEEEIAFMTDIARLALKIKCQYSKSCEAIKDVCDLLDTVDDLRKQVEKLERKLKKVEETST